MEPTTKQCTKCKKAKSLELFPFLKGKERHGAQCKECKRARDKVYRDTVRKPLSQEDKAKAAAKIKAKRKANPEKEKARAKAYREGHRGQARATAKRYTEANRDEIRRKDKIRHKQNPEKAKEYNDINRETINKNRRDRDKEKRLTDQIFKLKELIRGAIRQAFKIKGFNKKTRTAEMLGTDFETFEAWLTSVSETGPEFESVELDHVTPISLAKTEAEVIALNHYTNFQWLSPEENGAKSNNYTKRSNLNRVLDNHPNPELIKMIIEREGHEIKEV